MNCEQVQERMADYLGSELGAAGMKEVELHAESCAACGREIASLRATMRVLGSLGGLEEKATVGAVGGASAGAVGEASAGVVSGATEGVVGGASAGAIRVGVFRPLAYAAVLLIGLGIGWFAGSAGVGEQSVMPIEVIDRDASSGGINESWIEAYFAEAGGMGSADPIARNAVRLVRSLSSSR